jgi:uncharacterized protein
MRTPVTIATPGFRRSCEPSSTIRSSNRQRFRLACFAQSSRPSSATSPGAHPGGVSLPERRRPLSFGRQDRRTLSWKAPGLRLVVVADTHGRPHPKAAEQIAALKPDQILHAGDIGDLSVLDQLAKLAPVHAVRGNIDVKAPDLVDALTLEVVDDSRSLLTLLLVHIAVHGPKLRRDAAELARQEGASLVVCGHSHVPFIGRDRGLSVFNPGSIGPRRFQLPVLFGVIDIDHAQVRLTHIDCETGQRWQAGPRSSAATARR